MMWGRNQKGEESRKSSGKRFLSLLLCAAMGMTLLAGCGSSSDETSETTTETEASASSDTDTSTEADTSSDTEVTADESVLEGKSIGITVQSLTNAYWAGVMSRLEELLEDAGASVTLVSCDDNAGTQVSQVENFITSGVDLIMVHTGDPDSMETVCGEAMDAGIKVMCWDEEMENTDVDWVLDNTELGMAIGEAAADFINTYYTSDDPAEVCIVAYDSNSVLLERRQGIEAALEEYCEDNYEIVATCDGLEAAEAQTNVETVLSANPECTVFVTVGAGGMIGANEALVVEYGTIPENVGVIGTDVTEQQLELLMAGDQAVRAIIGMEGSNTDTAQACMELFERLLAGEEFTGEDHSVYRPIMEITDDNIEEIMEGM